MVKLSNIEEHIDDEILDSIFREREENLNTRTEEDKKEIMNISKKYPTNYEEILSIINNFPEDIEKEKVLNKFDDYCMKENLITAYENEKFYKIGFCDGIRTVLENLKKK
ncbi:MAG: hypothetical protein K2H53_01775 [Clostridia bacterium]|nr:hypothetical protein [Clostridia bacterium]